MQISSDIVALREYVDTKLSTLCKTEDSKFTSINKIVGFLTKGISNIEKSIVSLKKYFSNYAIDKKIAFALQKYLSKLLKHFEFGKHSYRNSDFCILNTVLECKCFCKRDFRFSKDNSLG